MLRIVAIGTQIRTVVIGKLCSRIYHDTEASCHK